VACILTPGKCENQMVALACLVYLGNFSGVQAEGF